MDKAILYTARQMAAILECHPQTIYRLADRGDIGSIKVGGLRRFLLPEGEQNNAERRTDGAGGSAT